MLKRLIKVFIVIFLIIALLNIPVRTRQGFNYDVRVLKMPLYIKIIEFIDRDYHYRRLVNEITAGCNTDKEEVLAIFSWVTENIRIIPEEFDVVDDHVLNIIIRRYGATDQMCDVFTTLLVYSGIPAFRGVISPDSIYMRVPVAYVRLNNKWCVFHVYDKLFFTNSNGEIASVEDIISDINIVREKGMFTNDVSYEDLYKNLKPIDKDFMSKEEMQVPSLRAAYEIRRLFRNEKKK